jgi:hypothetical protein
MQQMARQLATARHHAMALLTCNALEPLLVPVLQQLTMRRLSLNCFRWP